MIVVMIMGLLAMVALPNIKTHTRNAGYQAIIANLQAIDLAKQAWGHENRKSEDSVPTEQELAPYFAREKFPSSVAGERYNIKSIKERATATSGFEIASRGIAVGSEITADPK